ncbi:glycerophosphodiester phosphodiesterase [Jeotgalibacillus salarius]|uniref:Glycerophosphodiester phosphodiesterase n=1 Tax=Jeotgalibacillus salarius TaxID=546023 RepID=A0A4Y8LKU3_9BACL|nr:glycerophosphodiester phosphodiesterase [Jeotgalibacillus salarius]TFE03182.1 glycerophosphodiester phosphodiesterase [Jeotgalibacillus salarius]
MSNIFAHRGSSGKYPENTMLAFKKAEKTGCYGIELDVQMSKDRECFVIHDETVNRTTNGRGYIKDKTLKEIKKFSIKSGWLKKERIPLLDEVLEWAQHNSLIINIELKNDKIRYEGMEELVVQKVAKFNLEERVIFSTFNLQSVRKLKELTNSEVAALYSKKGTNPLLLAQSTGADAIHANQRVMTEKLMKDCQQNGVPVRLYTLNKPVAIEKWIQAGLNGVITDYPELAEQLKKKRAVKA